MKQLTDEQLHTKINRFMNRKSQEFDLKNPLERMQPRARTISRREIIKSYQYAPTAMHGAYLQ